MKNITICYDPDNGLKEEPDKTVIKKEEEFEEDFDKSWYMAFRIVHIDYLPIYQESKR